MSRIWTLKHVDGVLGAFSRLFRQNNTKCDMHCEQRREQLHDPLRKKWLLHLFFGCITNKQPATARGVDLALL